MFDGLLCYVTNTYSGLSRVCGSLDGIVREMAMSRSVRGMTGDIETLLPGVEKFLQERDGVCLGAGFTMPTAPEGGIKFLEYQ